MFRNFDLFTSSRLGALVGVSLLGLVSTPVLRPADVLIGDGHIDLNLGYSAGSGFVVTANYSGPATETDVVYPISEAVFVLGDAAMLTSPGASLVDHGFGDYSILGPEGATAWVVDQVQADGVTWVGFGAYGIGGTHDDRQFDFDGFDGASVRVGFLGFSGPDGANFALWTYGPWGNLIPVFSSDQTLLAAPDEFSITDGSHVHYAWGFTRPGDYVVHLALDGMIDGVPVPSGAFDVRFSVIPEPASFAWIAGLACVSAAGLRRRPRRT